ncbi:MarR family winged helix-turn-helix transcriptional regulator [Roseibium salinum]|uniref:MarR family winged helix-turn-helix transcriptional regulator n=1 Tax=Roseibium salinum TaxID=1604349 RepID=UPI003609F28D
MTHVSPDLVNDIRAASRRLVREFGFLDKTIAGTDLSGSGVHAILEIGLNPGLTAKDLVARLKLEKSTISRLLKSLEARGEIEQARSASDGRAFGLNLTQAGQQTFAAINRFADGQVRARSHASGTATLKRWQALWRPMRTRWQSRWRTARRPYINMKSSRAIRQA